MLVLGLEEPKQKTQTYSINTKKCVVLFCACLCVVFGFVCLVQVCFVRSHCRYLKVLVIVCFACVFVSAFCYVMLRALCF